MSFQTIEKYLTIYPDKNRACIDVGGGNNLLALSKLFKDVFLYQPCDNEYSELERIANLHVRQNVLYSKMCPGRLVSDAGCHYFEEDDSGEIDSHVLDFENIHLLDFLKVDTYGNEILILKGARQLLNRCKPLVQVAITNYRWTKDNQSVYEYMNELGYRVLDEKDGYAYFWIPELVTNIENNTIFCFWTGTNPMTHNRLGCMYNLRTQTESNIVLVTVDNLAHYIKPDDPLHEAYQYLSETHKCDYLRIYFMHHYGGGYTDIKSPRRSWAEAFKQMRDDPTKIINGYHEKGEHAIAYKPAADKWAMLCGNGSYILRPRTALTYAWYKAMIAKMDEKLDQLRLHPACRVEDAKEWGTGYPLEWNEMLGRIFHRVLADFEGFILYTTPKVFGGWYR